VIEFAENQSGNGVMASSDILKISKSEQRGIQWHAVHSTHCTVETEISLGRQHTAWLNALFFVFCFGLSTDALINQRPAI
jgi:hypothetical protein